MNDTDTRFAPACGPQARAFSDVLWKVMVLANLAWTLALAGIVWYGQTDALSNVVWLGRIVYATSVDEAGISARYDIGLGSRSADQGVCVWRRSATPGHEEELQKQIVPREAPQPFPSLQGGSPL